MNKQKTPFVHIIRRKTLPWYAAWGIRIASIIVALIVCALVILPWGIHVPGVYLVLGIGYLGILLLEAVSIFRTALLSVRATGISAPRTDPSVRSRESSFTSIGRTSRP